MPIDGNVKHGIAAALEIGGRPVPIYSYTVTLNAYTAASTIDVQIPIFFAGVNKVTDAQSVDDWIALQRQSIDGGSPLLAVAKLGITSIAGGSKPTVPTQLLQLEQGFVDEINPDMAANEQSFTCRTEIGKWIQDQRVAAPLQKNVRGDQIVSAYFAKYAPAMPLTILQTSPVVQGSTYDDATYTKGIRGLSPWDYISNAAADDGYVLLVHNGKASYGPSALGAPTVNLAWGKDLLDCQLRSASSRSRNVAVKLYGYNARKQYKLLAKYPSTSAQGAEIYPVFVTRQIDTATALAKATAYAKEIQTREIVAEVELPLGPTMLSILAANGANFLVQLDSGLPSSSGLFHVKQAVVNVRADGESEASAKVHLTMENHAPSSAAV